MPQPLAPILPSAPEVSIVTSSRGIPDMNSDGWAYGISHREDFCRTVGSWARCVEEAEGSYPERTPEALGDDDFPVFQPWSIYASFTCTSLADWPEARRTAVETLKAKTPYSVARELWTGEESGSPSLQSTGTDISDADAQPAQVVLSELGANFDECSGGAQPTFHVPSRLIYQLIEAQVVVRSGDRLLTPTGGIVIPGPGYPNTPGAWGPDASPGPLESAEGEAWMYVTGPVELAFSETWEQGSGEPPVGTFARLNRSELFVEREAIYRFPTCCVFGALAALSA
jgi:hypothetical protein